ncbi:MAG: hypothetical protein ACC645_23825, partial [Pirellulales bacterium]
IEQGILDGAIHRDFSGDGGAETEAEPLALRLTDLVVHDNRKWWGEAEIRVDAVVVHGNSASSTVFEAQTIRFERVADGDRVIDEPVLLYYGRPRCFIDFSLCVSRNTKDSDDLSNLLGSELQSSNMKAALENVVALGPALPEAAVLAAAVAGAAQIGTLAYKVLRNVTGATVGVYRASWLEHRDKFGIGRHLPDGSYRSKDLSFQYEIIPDRAT